MCFYVEDGTYAMKKVLIKSNEQLELVREEIRVSSLFNHPNLLLLLNHAIISVKEKFSSFQILCMKAVESNAFHGIPSTGA
ncbi:hypothetical protein HN51_069973 [Arachis hypogaea]